MLTVVRCSTEIRATFVFSNALPDLSVRLRGAAAHSPTGLAGDTAVGNMPLVLRKIILLHSRHPFDASVRVVGPNTLVDLAKYI